MTLRQLTQAFPWSRYSKKLTKKIEAPRSIGYFTQEQSEERTMRLAIGKEGSLAGGNIVQLYWLVDPEDGIIVDARFQVYGQSALIGAAEIACELVVGKNYEQARRIHADLLDKQVRDRGDEPAFPKEAFPHLNIVLGAMDQAADQCMDIPLPINFVATPTPREIGEIFPNGHPEWASFSTPQKIGLIEEVIAQDVRPYIELDAGGIQVIDLLNDKEVIIQYSGSCTSCFSATGTTLSYIQQVLRGKVHPSLLVIPS
jgi:NifU-like protein